MMGRSDFIYDKRLAERFIRSGQVNIEDYRRHLETLPDVEGKSEALMPAEDAAVEDPAIEAE